MGSDSPTLVWFRQDLRLTDNPALSASVERGRPIIPVFIWAPDEEGAWRPGGASKWWLGRSLSALATDLEKRGSKLIIRRGPTAPSLLQLLAESGASSVFWNRRYEPAAIASGIVVRNVNVQLALLRQTRERQVTAAEQCYRRTHLIVPE